MWARPLGSRNALLLRNAPATAGEFNVLRTALLLTVWFALPVVFPVELNSVLRPTELFAGVWAAKDGLVVFRGAAARCGAALCGAAARCGAALCGAAARCGAALCGATARCGAALCGAAARCGAALCGAAALGLRPVELRPSRPELRVAELLSAGAPRRPQPTTQSQEQWRQPRV